MKKAGCTTATAKPAGKNGGAAGMVSAVKCSGDGKSEFIGFRTTSADQVAGAMKALTASSASATTIYYVKGTNWAVMKSDDGQKMPTKSGTEAMQKKIGSGTVRPCADPREAAPASTSTSDVEERLTPAAGQPFFTLRPRCTR
ncbi:hypothetical protein [Calidifontibacter indicus]|uniref:Uncharacterized protein n=1 Tax=Calidifontibacter indicus TaxID=419650 RepID=A0A3D9UT26_9MICO|nr:hypothetical protein [Calidifontibacter indicus]REF29144.1 hypothetical protein DFJ65_0077 [Calidifontibacter indicus]